MPSTTHHTKPADLILRITCAMWLLAKLYSYKIWIADRLLPLLPPWDFLLQVPGYVHWVLLVVSCTCLVAIIVKPDKRLLLGIFIIAELLACLLDQNRWQPWEYQYLCMAFMCWANFNRKTSSAISAILFLFVCLYVYSGLNKLNEEFLYSIWGKTVLHQFMRLPPTVMANPIVHYAGYAVAIAESLAGIGLLFVRSRRAGAYALIGMHIFTLVWLGPLGLHINAVVWPWNLCMIACLYVLCIKNKGEPLGFVFKQIIFTSNAFIAILWGIMPAFGFIHFWDNYLSASLYSGKLPYLSICIKNTAAVPELQPYFSKNNSPDICNGASFISLYNWAIKETGVPPYPEERVFKKVRASFVKKYPAAGAEFMISHHDRNQYKTTEFNK